MKEKLLENDNDDVEKNKEYKLDNKDLVKKTREENLFSNQYQTLNEPICTSLVI